MMEFRAFAIDEMQAKTHRIGDGQDVGKQDCRIQIEAFERLQGDFASQFGRFRQGQKAASALACGAILGQVATGLTHDPYGRGVDGLALERAQEAVFGHGQLQGFSGQFLFAASRSDAASPS